MSVENFKKTLWEGALLANFHSVSIADAISTKPAKIDGNKIMFNRVGAGSVKDYVGEIKWDEVDTTPLEMTFDKEKYFAFSLDDVDRVQLVGDVMAETTAEHSSTLAETYDKDVLATLASGAKTANITGSKSNKVKVSSANIYDYIVDLGTVLGKNKTPKTDRFVTVDSAILGLLAKDRRFTSNPNVLENGIVEGQKINGMQVVSTEEKPVDQIIAHHKSAIGAAKQLDKIEAMRLQGSFADGIRGLCKYGAKVLREEAIAVLHNTVVATGDVGPTRVEVTNTVTTKPEA